MGEIRRKRSEITLYNKKPCKVWHIPQGTASKKPEKNVENDYIFAFATFSAGCDDLAPDCNADRNICNRTDMKAFVQVHIHHNVQKYFPQKKNSISEENL